MLAAYRFARGASDFLAHVFWQASYWAMCASTPFQRMSITLTARIDPEGVAKRKALLDFYVQTNKDRRDAW